MAPETEQLTLPLTVEPTELDTTEPVEMSAFARSIYESKYAYRNDAGDLTEDWFDTARRVTTNVLGALDYVEGDLEFDEIHRLIRERKFMPGGRYLYASGRELHQVQNCLLLKVEDSREGWAELSYKAELALMTGAGIGVDYSNLRASGSPIKKTGGLASGPIAKMRIINEIGRNVMQGGARRSAIWAGLNWRHDDIETFITLKNWPQFIRDLKEKDPNFPAEMDFTNISVLLDDDFFAAYRNPDHTDHAHAHHIYFQVIRQMVKTAEPGLSVDLGLDSKETLRNACTEVTSEDDSDICNLGSINLARIEDEEEMEKAVKYGTLFLLAGTIYSHVPYAQVSEIREKNRRLGLGVMGVHEWLLKHGHRYGPNEELGKWLSIYKESGTWADAWSWKHHLSCPVKTRAIAPTGTIGIIAETTTGIEPIFCVAYKRRVRTAQTNGHDTVSYQYVLDPTAKRLVDAGVDPMAIEDAYTLSYDVERRIAFQAWMQQFVDHGISSTINLPAPISDPEEAREFGEILMRHLPNIRGMTVYPDGARGGQPLTAVGYEEAASKVGVVFEESEERCKSGACGI